MLTWGETSEHAYNLILEAIVEGKFSKDKRLRESELTELTGVSRTPVREALNRLTQDGIVVQEKNRGAQLVEFSFEDEQELLLLRAKFEPYASRLAASRITEAAIEELTVVAERMESYALKEDFSAVELGRLNNSFHNILIESSGSLHLKNALQSLVIPAYVARTFREYTKTGLERSLRHHRELIEACRAQDGEWAEAVMLNHILAARRSRS